MVFKKSDYNEYNELVNIRQKKIPSDYVRERRAWWCFDNENDGAFAAAFYDGEVVATCFISGKMLNINKKQIFAYEIGETATKLEHQRKGLFSKLVKACLAYAFDNGAELVYGTPNSQSTPGYQKLGFKIIESKNSNLQFLPSINGLMRKKLKIRSDGMNRMIDSMSSGDFYKKSTDFPRLNVFNEKYFKWRFILNKNLGYNFFERNNFIAAIRPVILGGMDVLQVSEYHFTDLSARPSFVAKRIKDLCARNYDMRNYCGIYFLSEIPGRLQVIKNMTISVFHRNLPICVIANKNAPDIYQYLEICGLPQLSDCDIG